MPKDYNLEATPANQQRRNELVQDDEWINEFLQRASIGHIATRWDEQPFITPTTYWYDGARHEIYFHSNVVGRIRANSEHHDRVCFEASEFGQLLPSNVELEFSIQFKSVVAWIFLTEPWSIIDEQHGVLWSLFSFGASASNYSLKVFRIFSA